MRAHLEKLQPLGRALMLPIAVLPVAAILLRVGQPDLLGLAFVAAAGEAIFSNLGILFAIGVAVGLARENHGAAGLAGAVAYFVTIEGAKALMAVAPEASGGFADQAAIDLSVAAWKATQMAKLSVPCGILSGLLAGWLYNRYANIRVPDYLAFFGGRRFVPIAAGLAGIFGALLFGLGFPLLAGGIDSLSHWVVQAGGFGLFLYGLLNRLLIVTGLHHILNNLAWFIVGDFAGTTGDLKRFFAGDPTAGRFMAGFFPVMMFGLPAACLAIYHAAAPDRRRQVGGMLLSLGLTSFLTGITEPIEFTFMFLAPLLYLVHAVLTGASMALMDALGVRLGFGFSAGLFDYVLNYPLSTRPLLLIPVGLGYAAVYYAAFRYCIVRFDLQTPGRERNEDASPADLQGTPAAAHDPGDRIDQFISALGGRSNLHNVDACTTRLRLRVGETPIDEPRLKALGARGFVRPGPGSLQVVLGPIADQVAVDIRNRLASAPGSDIAERIIAAIGGEANISAWHGGAGRVSLLLRNASLANIGEVEAALSRSAAFVAPQRMHLITGPHHDTLAQHLSALMPAETSTQSRGEEVG